jgi:hypothetical protein
LPQKGEGGLRVAQRTAKPCYLSIRTFLAETEAFITQLGLMFVRDNEMIIERKWFQMIDFSVLKRGKR